MQDIESGNERQPQWAWHGQAPERCGIYPKGLNAIYSRQVSRAQILMRQ